MVHPFFFGRDFRVSDRSRYLPTRIGPPAAIGGLPFFLEIFFSLPRRSFFFGAAVDGLGAAACITAGEDLACVAAIGAELPGVSVLLV
jgi:hypothetical protein